MFVAYCRTGQTQFGVCRTLFFVQRYLVLWAKGRAHTWSKVKSMR